MQCPDCGYMMTVFDKECPRCTRLKKHSHLCLNCGTLVEAGASACFHCGKDPIHADESYSLIDLDVHDVPPSPSEEDQRVAREEQQTLEAEQRKIMIELTKRILS